MFRFGSSANLLVLVAILRIHSFEPVSVSLCFPVDRSPVKIPEPLLSEDLVVVVRRSVRLVVLFDEFPRL